MDIFKRLDIQAEKAADELDEYLESDPEALLRDGKEFIQASNKSMVAQWAVSEKLSSNYEVAKKIIDSI